MVFNSYIFFVFFAFVLAAYYGLPASWWKPRKIVLVVSSYIFYAAWSPPFVLLLWLSTITDWWIGKRLDAATKVHLRRVLLCASLAVNLGLLGYFKYGDFLLDNCVALLSLAGVEYSPVRDDIVLPVGISFYTFQTLSYTLDIYFRRERRWTSFTDFALYVTFFPQLVAGPIVRASEFLPQCERPRKAAPHEFAWGLWLLVLGLFEKVVLADGYLAPVVDKVFKRAAEQGFTDAWVGTLAFAGQIFCDFAGYSTCAIGVAMCLGFSLPDNFRFPYAALGFSDFWRRWHISLSSWLRDYLYIPLGGNRRGRVRTYVNLFLTMLIGGLWHGASWTFVVWGALHGIYLGLERLLRGRIRLRSALGRSVGIFATFVAVCFAWVFFRAATFATALDITGGMLGVNAGFSATLVPYDEMAQTLLIVGAIFSVHHALRNTTLEATVGGLPAPVRGFVLALMVGAIFTLKGEDRAFIYFQF